MSRAEATPGAVPLFAFERVGVVRGDVVVLDDVTVAIPDQGVTALVGASGSGKSTMLRCCNRLEEPSTGRLQFRGADLASLDPRAHRRRVAMIFQAPFVFAGTALDNLRVADATLDRDAAAELLTSVALPAAVLDREADRLSGGEAQRLCLARALATRPEAILADEPTSALDSASTAVLEDLARSLADAGTPVVWVSHDRAQVQRLADHLVTLERGRVTASGPVSDLGGEGTA